MRPNSDLPCGERQRARSRVALARGPPPCRGPRRPSLPPLTAAAHRAASRPLPAAPPPPTRPRCQDGR
eukprot:1154704-Prorocentrum_minimum.AAC.1